MKQNIFLKCYNFINGLIWSSHIYLEIDYEFEQGL